MRCRDDLPKLYESKTGSKKVGCGRTPEWPILEEIMDKKIRFRRKNGLKVSPKWIMLFARKTFKERWPKKPIPSFTANWVQKFEKRKGFSLRQPTKMAVKPPESKELAIRDYHHRLRRVLKIERAFDDAHVANCDQTPCPLNFLSGKTIDVKGSKQVWVRNTGSGHEKRFCTVHLTVYADGKPRLPPYVIFRGMGKRISNSERQKYHPRVRVLFQNEARVDEATFLAIIRNLAKSVRESGPILLTLDQHRAHKALPVKLECQKSDITLLEIPGGCTGDVQVLDVAFNRDFKRLLQECFENHLEENLDKWEKGGFSASDKRIFVTKWVGIAWDRLHQEGSNDAVKKAFKRTGTTLNPDGSEDHRIKIDSLPDYRPGLPLNFKNDSKLDYALIPSDDSEAEESDLNESFDSDISYLEASYPKEFLDRDLFASRNSDESDSEESVDGARSGSPESEFHESDESDDDSPCTSGNISYIDVEPPRYQNYSIINV